MTIALFAVPSLLAPLHGFFRWLGAGAGPSSAAATASAGSNRHPNAIKSVSGYTYQAGVSATIVSKKAPVKAFRALRVVRVLEAGQASASVGRMVISGRMADVCAELDRLAAREAMLH
jgi:hypothetical protein